MTFASCRLAARRAVLAAFVACLAGAALGPHAARGQTSELVTFSFLRLDPSARAAALAGSFGAVGDGDVNAMFYNPALLGPATHKAVSASYLNHLADINAGFLASSYRVERLRTTFGAGLRFVTWGEFERADETGQRQGTFTAGDVVLTLGAARAYGERLRYGANVHVVYSAIETARASALAADLGVAYRLPMQDFVVSAAVTNAGRALRSFGRTRDTLPTDVRLSVSKELAYLPLMLTATGYDVQNLGRGVENGTTLDNALAHLTFGAELTPVEAFRLRLGYDHRRAQELDLGRGLAGVGAGFGLAVNRLRIDYAYNAWSSFGGLHRFTLMASL